MTNINAAKIAIKGIFLSFRLARDHRKAKNKNIIAIT